MLISIEGIDGAGKTTQIQMLENYLLQRNRKFIIVREPGGTIFSEKIREILLESDFEIDKRAELLLFEAARIDLVEKIIKPKLAEGFIIITDRFYDSTTAYQAYGRGIDLETTLKLHDFAVDGIHPNKTIFLNISRELSKMRISNKKKDRIESAGEEFFDKVYNGFQEISQRYKRRINVIDASNDKDTVHKDILKAIGFE